MKRKKNTIMPHRVINVKTVEDTSSEINMEVGNRNRVQKVFRPYLFMFRCYGFFIDTKLSGCRLVLNYIHCILILCAMLVNLCRFFSVFITKTESEIREQKVSTVTLLFIQSGSSYLQFSNLIGCSLHLTKFLSKLQEYDRDFGMSLNFRKAMKVARITSIVSITTVVPATIIAHAYTKYILNHWPDATITIIVTPFHTWNSTSGEVAMLGCSILNAFTSSSFFAFCVFYVFMSYVFYKEFSTVNKQMEAWIKEENDVDNFEENFEHQRRKHEHIVQMVSHGNQLLHHLIFALYAMSIPVICLTIYGLLYGRLTFMDIIFSAQFLGLCIMAMIVITAIGICVHTAAHAPLDFLLLFDTLKMSNNLKHQIQLLISRLIGPPIGLNMYGLLVLDKSIVLMLFGTVITYVVVVLQMK